MKCLFPLILTLTFSAFGQMPTASPWPAQNQENEAQPIKVNTFLVNIPVIAGDRNGRNVTGLTKDNFTLLEDGEKQPIEFFADEEAPVSVAIMIDTSGSTKFILKDIQKAARNFIKVLRPEDKAMIISFDGQFKVLSELTANHQDLEKAVNEANLIKMEGFSMQDAIYDVIKNKFAEVQGRKAVIILTDGGEFGDRITKEQLLSTASKSDTVIYPVLFGKLKKAKPPIEFFRGKKFTMKNGEVISGEEFIKRMQEKNEQQLQFIDTLGIMTAGRTYESDSKDFNKIFQTIADELKKQYVIGFYPKSDDGKEHVIAVEVDPKDIVIRTKQRIQLKSLN